jgi:hypothetical protein
VITQWCHVRSRGMVAERRIVRYPPSGKQTKTVPARNSG